MPLFKINAKLLPMKIHYFLFNAGTAPFILFGPTIAKQLGYTALTVGTIYTVLPLVALITKPSLCAIADKFRLRRALFLASIAICLITMLALMFVPERSLNTQIELRCHQELHMVSCNEDVDESEYRNEINKLKPVNETFNCELSCSGTNIFVQDLCKSWRINKYCSVNSLSTNQIHSSMPPKTGNILPGKTAYEKSRQINELQNHYAEDFTFTGSISVNNVFALSKCVFARIRNVTFGYNSKSHIPYCKEMKELISTTCNLHCKEQIDFVELFNPEVKIVTKRYEFWLLFLLFILNWAAVAVNTVMSDTVCFDLLGNEAHKYGITRLFGSLGWGLSSILCGWLTDFFSQSRDEKNYAPLFSIGAAIILLDLFVATSVRVQQKNYSLSITRDIGKLFRNIRIVVFTMWCFYIGLCSALIWQFLFWHLEKISTTEELKWSKTLQGLDSVFATILGELPFFFLSGMIIKRIGHVHSMSLVLLALALRLFLYSLLVRPVWVLPIELTNGFTFGIFYATMASYASTIAPSGTEATTQGLFGSAFDGYGLSIGSLIGGYVFDKYGGSIMYRTFGIISVCICLIHVAIQYFFIKPAHPYRDQMKDFETSARPNLAPNEMSMMLQDQ